MSGEERRSAWPTRRDFLKTSGGGLAGAALLSQSSLAFAQPDIRGPAHRTIPLNHNWLFGGEYVRGSEKPGFADNGFERVSIPHANATFSWHNFDRSEYQYVSIYRRHFTLPPGMRGHRVFVDFEGAMAASTVTINGQTLGEYKGGYSPFSFELTGHVDWDGDNVLAVQLDSRKSRTDIPPFAPPVRDGFPDYDTFGGIYREVSLRLVPRTFIDNVRAKPVEVLSDDRRRLDVTCYLDRAAGSGEPLVVEAELRNGERLIAQAATEAFSNDQTVDLTLKNLEDVALWDVDDPQLYEVRVRLRERRGRDRGGRPVHEYRTRVGFREAFFEEQKGFFLNGRRLQLFGLNRHQIFPYVGNAMPARVQRRDADILKNELNCNMVRTSHYQQSPHFLDACDELGILVWADLTGQERVPDDEAWRDTCAMHLRKIIHRDWNRPSVILWCTKIPGSALHRDFEDRLDALAHELDDTRQTVGNHQPNQYDRDPDVYQRQDVWGQNDYFGTTMPPNRDRYLINETVGQSNPNGRGYGRIYRRTSLPRRQQEQAERHASAHNGAAFYAPQHAGALGWCAFEYHSGRAAPDEIKAPGVYDIFRIPKPGATFYRSQVNPREKVVLEPAFYWAFGWRSPQGPGKDAMVCSNCERLDIYIDGELLASKEPDRENYGNLTYPPFFADLEFDRFPDSPPGVCRIGERCQAENGELNAYVNVNTRQGGHTGSGYVTFPNGSGGEAIAEWTIIEVPQAGEYTLHVRHAHGDSRSIPGEDPPHTLRLHVNGERVKYQQFPNTGGWGAWEFLELPVRLTEGRNTISFRRSPDDPGISGVNIDFIAVTGADTKRLPELRIDGFIGGQKVTSRSFSSDPSGDRLLVAADDAEIAGDGIDATRVYFRAVDRYGAPRPFVQGKVELEIEGPGEIIGDNPFDFEAAGGAGAVWVKSVEGSAGKVVLRVTHPDLGDGKAVITVKRPRNGAERI